jgi:hypothetical protein
MTIQLPVYDVAKEDVELTILAILRNKSTIILKGFVKPPGNLH